MSSVCCSYLSGLQVENVCVARQDTDTVNCTVNILAQCIKIAAGVVKFCVGMIHMNLEFPETSVRTIQTRQDEDESN